MIPLNKPSEELVIDLINRDNPDAHLKATKVLLQDPVVNEGEGETLNTRVVVKARKNSGYRDSQEVKFDRLNLADLLRNVNVFVNVHNPKNTAELLVELNKQIGTKLAASDLVIHDIAAGVNPPLANPEDPDPEPVAHKLTAISTCRAYIGEATIFIGPRPQVGERLELVILKRDLDGLAYPDGYSETKGQAYIYSYGSDCTPINIYLATLTTNGSLDTAKLAIELNKVFADEWRSGIEAADYNVSGATITYAGPTVTQESDGSGGTIDKPVPGANTDYGYVVKIRLGALCSNFQGDLHLHYNK